MRGGMAMIIFLITMLLICVPLEGRDNSVNDSEWTWCYKKSFSDTIRGSNRNKKELIFAQENVPLFTQLILSWNVFRPTTGYFAFYVQVRDAATKQWGTWHHIADWGQGIQKSYLSKSDGFSSHVHVRLEVENKKAADAFRIKIEPQKTASLSLVQAVCVALSDFTTFKAESPKEMVSCLQSVHLPRVPLIAQMALEHVDKARICSPVSCSMMVHYVTGQQNNPLEFAAGAFDEGMSVYGSWPYNVAHAFELAHGKAHFFVRRMNSFSDLHQQLVNGMPVVVSVRGTLPGALKPFPHGHLMVVVGWDNDAREVLCHDPASDTHEAVFKRYPLEHFLRAWECSHRLAYVVEPIGSCK